MKHSVVYTNTDSHWDNALPLGNGVYGAMLYYEKNVLHMPTNHYEVYYNREEHVLPEEQLKAMPIAENPGEAHEARVKMADGNRPVGGEPFAEYRGHRQASYKANWAGKISGQHPKTGDFAFRFAEELKGADNKLALYTEDAKTVFTLGGAQQVSVDTRIARKDCIISRIEQSESGLLSAFEIELTPQRDMAFPCVTYTQADEKTFVYTVEHTFGKKVFRFAGMVRLVGAKGKMNEKTHGAAIEITDAGKEFYILTSVFTDFNYEKPETDGIAVMDAYENSIAEMYTEHKAYWDAFFKKSSISIPDKFLEHIYFINQYALDCCSGKDGVMKHHACGLNGLWDTRHPNLWGSMWYWDVNIQAAFAGVFSSNRLDLAKVFSDGLLSYVDLAKRYAKNLHNAPGIAGDYPYDFYYCVWPWCAQYLWFLYEYSLDKDYLEKDAYPLFLGLCEFYCAIFKYDTERGYYSVYPDICPEQGPLSHDTVITVSSVNYLFKFTLEAAEILGKDDAILGKVKEIMNNMAPYAVSEEGLCGKHLKDSEDAPDNLFVRHPSMLMPLFPIGELGLHSDADMVEVLKNTITYLEDRSEIGIFIGSWLAAGAARLGQGQKAIRLLDERGVDHKLRANGLTAEETDRFINFCLVNRQPLYYSCMMEFTGEMLVAVNEMLIQSHAGLIRVFPALPDGDAEYERAWRNGWNAAEFEARTVEYPAWKTLRFDKLLCKGAFEVSASMTEGVLDFILVHSKKGGKVNLTSPYITDALCIFCAGEKVEFTTENNVLSFDTQAGKTYTIAEAANAYTEAPASEYEENVLQHYTYTKRYISIGEDKETVYRKALDGVIRDWYVGNARHMNHTVYKFDFTNQKGKKYYPLLERQSTTADFRTNTWCGFWEVGNENLAFTPLAGYGFKAANGIEIIDRGAPDVLRQDFASGSADAEFIIEAPRGQYELFICSGDENEDSVTVLEAVGGRSAGGKMVKKGEYQCALLPFIKETDDELICLKVSTKAGYNWKLNYIILNVIKGY